MNKKAAIVTIAFLAVGYSLEANADGNTVYMSHIVPYSEGNSISRAILSECQLPQEYAQFIEEMAKAQGIPVVRDDEAVKAGKGRILQVEITDAISSGNAFIGHRKQVSVKGRLLEEGKEIGNFVGQRSSMGGAFAGFKGSCSVLGRCAKALAEDLTTWLKDPTKTSRIGE